MTSDNKKGAGQYFTPGILIQSIVRCMKTNPCKRVAFMIGDPTCGTGGFRIFSY
ncbi:MAG: N-6 DNA methylase [Methanoregula sp.]